MEETAISIIEQWKEETGYIEEVPLSSVRIKYADHDAGIYTLYLDINPIARIKAVRDLSAWKIIELK